MMLFEKNKNIEVVKLYDWLNWAAGNAKSNNGYFVALPMIQRGSVWKPHQIIDLWDSLFQGMPIGSLMVSVLKEGTPVHGLGKVEVKKISAAGGIGLVDGQQRTMSLLLAWQLADGITMDRRVWIDFADTPQSGQLFRVRITTINHPFGFQRNEPSRKLSLNDRRKASEAFKALCPDKSPTLENALPFSNTLGLPVDLKELISWKINDTGKEDGFVKKVFEKIGKIAGAKLNRSQDEKKWEKVNVYEKLSDKESIKTKIEDLYGALDCFLNQEIPLIKVNEDFFKVDKNNLNNTPLAILFKRIGAGGTALSDSDYVYSIIKHLCPETYSLIEGLHQKQNISSVLSATDIVMSVVRLTAIEMETSTNNEKPTKEDFHRLLQKNEFLAKFLEFILPKEKSEPIIAEYFKQIHATLLYSRDNLNGLPRHFFPLLGRPLIQVLLYLARIGFIPNKEDVNYNKYRNELLRLVLFWFIAVVKTNQSKASKLAFDVIKEKETKDLSDLCKSIHDKLIKQGVAVSLIRPTDLKDCLELIDSVENKAKRLRGESRFKAENNSNQFKYTFYRNHWWRPWTYHHPILLWLQREMVSTQFDKIDPMAGKDEDTPYDYDHILPKAHWGNWRGVSNGTRLLELAENKEISITGNSIGNVRVWSSSLNRSDGETSPKVKLELDLDLQNNAENELLKKSAMLFNPEETTNIIKQWSKASGGENPHEWDQGRTLDFQQAVETRSFKLYCRFYNELEFSMWYLPENKSLQTL